MIKAKKYPNLTLHTMFFISFYFLFIFFGNINIYIYTGIVTSGKAIVCEASDDRNQVFGLSVLGAAWGCGLIIGPALSGVLADPIGQYNLTITSED